jgi:hypothetical protein
MKYAHYNINIVKCIIFIYSFICSVTPFSNYDTYRNVSIQERSSVPAPTCAIISYIDSSDSL